jgi:hypothetical protein
LKSNAGVLHAETDGEYISGQVFTIDLLVRKLKLLPIKKR